MSMQIIRNLIVAAAILAPTFSHAALVINNLAAGTQGFVLDQVPYQFLNSLYWISA